MLVIFLTMKIFGKYITKKLNLEKLGKRKKNTIN